MATKIPKNTTIKPGESTDFQLHKSQQSLFNGILQKVSDYSEKRLARLIENTTEKKKKETLQNLLSDYVAGRVAIAWHRGHPIWIKVTKD